MVALYRNYLSYKPDLWKVIMSCKASYIQLGSAVLGQCSYQVQILNATISVNTASYLHASQNIRAVSCSESVLLEFPLFRFNSLPLFI
jgi:hypothetical protein